VSRTVSDAGGAVPAVPDWLELRSADSPVIVVAPHGGLRARPIRRSDGINDLHTAEVAMQIANRLDVHALVNHGCDRNDIDLNRIRQLVAKAPFFLAALRGCVDEIVARGQRPLVLLVHGWNMAVPWCDVGVGIRARGDGLYGRYPTLGRDRYDSFVRPLARRLFDVGLGASIGLRYPAAGRDNATQLFSGRHAEHKHEDVSALGTYGADERVDAVQLELGIPLRWPGWRRDAFVDALVASVEKEQLAHAAPTTTMSRADTWALEPKPPRPEIEPDAGCSLQAALDDGAGVFMGAEPTGPSTMATRVCIALADGSMLLFVGEGPWDGHAGRYEVAGYRWLASGEADRPPTQVSMMLNGPLVHYHTHEAFVDLEKGLSGADLAEADIELRYEAQGETYGRLVGHARVGSFDREIDVLAICQRGGRRASMPGDKLDVFLTGEADEPARVVELRGDDANAPSVCFSQPEANAFGRVDVSHGGESLLEAETPVRVPVYRLLPDGRVVCVTFGTVLAVPTGTVGVYERVEISDPPAPVGED